MRSQEAHQSVCKQHQANACQSLRLNEVQATKKLGEKTFQLFNAFTCNGLRGLYKLWKLNWNRIGIELESKWNQGSQWFRGIVLLFHRQLLKNPQKMFLRNFPKEPLRRKRTEDSSVKTERSHRLATSRNSRRSLEREAPWATVRLEDDARPWGRSELSMSAVDPIDLNDPID